MAYYVLKETELNELNELSASSLGVVQKDSGTAMNPNSRTLVIGLGGMGLSTVYNLKKTLEERIGKIPDSSTDIKFLSIDTSKADLKQRVESGVLSEKEIFPLHNDKIAIEIKRALNQDSRHLISRSVETILPPPSANFNPTLKGEGANQIRLAGRLSLMEPDIFQSLYTRITDAIKGLSDFVNRTLEVYIVAGIGGGTGSGLVVDIPYVVRKVLNDLGVRENRTRIFGYVYLPNVYDNGEVANLQNAYRNGYAALKEIDYYMNIDQINETYDATYPIVGDFSSATPIFNLCTLIGGRIASSIVVKDTKQAAIDCCVANLINQVTSAKASKDGNGESASSIADTFTASSFLDNVVQALKTIVGPNGEANFHESGSYKYSCVGSATLKFPSNAIVECFIGDAYAKMIDHMKKCADMVEEKNVKDFASGLISPDDILNPIINKFSSGFVEATIAEQEWNKRSVDSTHELDRYVGNKINVILSEFDQNDQLVAQAIASANNKAAEIFKDPARGPLYLATLLTSNPSAGGRVVGYYERINSYVKEINNRCEQIRNFLEQAKKDKLAIAADMQRFGRFNSNLSKFKDILQSIYKKELELELCERLKAKYYHLVSERHGVCYRMKQNLDTNFLYYVDIITRIGEILANNVSICAKELNPDTAEPGNILAFGDDECLKPLKYSVENSLENRRKALTAEVISAFEGALTDNILSNKDDWTMTESVNKHLGMSKPSKAFRAFVKGYKPFSDVVNQTFSSYFEAAYKDETDAEKGKIVSFIVNYLSSHSSPMFNVWPDFSWASVKDLQYQYMVIPNNMGEYWGKKFKENIGISSFGNNIYESPDQSAIYNYTMYAGMPMWLHSDIINYEKRYYAINSNGIHINENEKFRPTYREYPALMPKEQWFHATEGMNKYENSDELAVEADIKKLVSFCLKNGIIHRGQYGDIFVVSALDKLPEIGSDSMKRFVRSYSNKPENIDKGLVKEGATLYNALLEHYGEQQMTIASVGISNVRPDDEDKLAMIIRKQMRLVRKLREIRDYLTADGSVFQQIKEMNKEKEGNQKLTDFFRFMFYGLVAPGERGVWSYRLGEKLWPITSRLTVSESRPEMVQYMEMAVYNEFYNVENIDAHLKLLKQNVSKINGAINDGTFELTDLKKNYDNFVSVADNKLNTLDMKLASGDSLTMLEIEVKNFYEALKANFETFWSLFA